MSEYIDWWIVDLNRIFLQQRLDAEVVKFPNGIFGVWCSTQDIHKVAEIVGKEVEIECK